MENLRTILGVALLEKGERRILAAYNANGALARFAAQLEFERGVIGLLNNLYQGSLGETHVLTVQGQLLVVNVYKDFYLVVAAEPSENEVVLAQLMSGLHQALVHFCGKELSAKMVYTYYAETALLLNEALENGLLLTTDSEELVAKVLLQDMKRGRAGNAGGRGGVMGFFNFA